MNPDRLAKFSKEDLIKFHIRQAERIEYYENKCKNQEKVGQVFIEGKKYNVIFEGEDETK